MVRRVRQMPRRLIGVIPVVFVPSAPLLLPRLNPTPDDVILELREVCRSAVSALAPCTHIVVIGSAGVGLRPDAPPHPDGLLLWQSAIDDDVPLSLQVADWLLGSLGGERTVQLATVAGEAASGGIADLPPLADGLGVLVCGDGTATRVEKSPGHVVAGAVELDDAVTALLASGDTTGILRLDEALDRTFLLDGRPAWQAAAALVDASGGRVEAAAVGYADAPHNVWYVVATWQVALPGGATRQSDHIS